MYYIVSGPKSTVFGISAKYLNSRIDTYLCMIGTTLTLDKKPWGMVIIKSYVPSFGISFLSDLDNNHYLPMYNRYREDTFPGSGIPIYFLLVLSCKNTVNRHWQTTSAHFWYLYLALNNYYCILPNPTKVNKYVSSHVTIWGMASTHHFIGSIVIRLFPLLSPLHHNPSPHCHPHKY